MARAPPAIVQSESGYVSSGGHQTLSRAPTFRRKEWEAVSILSGIDHEDLVRRFLLLTLEGDVKWQISRWLGCPVRGIFAFREPFRFCRTTHFGQSRPASRLSHLFRDDISVNLKYYRLDWRLQMC